MTTKLKYPQVGAQTIKRGDVGPWGIEPSTKGRQQSLRRGDVPGQEGRPAGKVPKIPVKGPKGEVYGGSQACCDSGPEGQVVHNSGFFKENNIAATNPLKQQFDSQGGNGLSSHKEMSGIGGLPSIEKLVYPV